MTPNSQYLLDTNIISDLVRNPQGTIAHRIAEVGEDSVSTSIIVASELRFGAMKKGSSRLSEQLDIVLSAIDIIPLESPADHRYAELRHALEKAGTPIGSNDMLIAAQALSLNSTLITANISEFSRIPDLSVENWLAE